ncbi:MAG: hypothetical protein ACOY3E_00655 [Pseudomonadota bacterium]
MTANELLEMLATMGLSASAVGLIVAFFVRKYIENQFLKKLDQDKIRFSRLHDLRASAIAKLYEDIVQSEADLHDWVYMHMPVGVSPVEIKPHEVLQRIRALRLNAAKAKILLSESGWQPIDYVVQEFERVSQLLENRELLPDDEARWDAHRKAIDGLASSVLSAKQRLEGEFRTLLGAEVAW